MRRTTLFNPSAFSGKNLAKRQVDAAGPVGISHEAVLPASLYVASNIGVGAKRRKWGWTCGYPSQGGVSVLTRNQKNQGLVEATVEHHVRSKTLANLELFEYTTK